MKKPHALAAVLVAGVYALLLFPVLPHVPFLYLWAKEKALQLVGSL